MMGGGGAGCVGTAMEVDYEAVLGHIRGGDPLAGNAAGIDVKDCYIGGRFKLAKGLFQNSSRLVDIGGRPGPDGLHDADDAVQFC